MPTPLLRIILSQNARTDLHALGRAHSTPQSLSLRARMVLRAADIDTPTNLQIGRDLGCTNRTVGKWRRRFVALGLSGLQDAARSGRPRTMSPPCGAGHLGGQRVAKRAGPPRDTLDVRGNRGDRA